MARRVSSPRLVGRAGELAQLGAALERARAGSPAAVLVAGEAGVGKTRLVTEFAALATAGGVSVLSGGCVALVEGELAYAPLAEALRGLVQRLEPAAVTRLVSGDRGELARLLPDLGAADHQPPEQDLGVEAGRLRLFGVLHRLLARLAGDAAAVLVVEDLHWADRSSLEFLAYLIRNLREERLLLVGTWRSDELPRGHPVRRWLAEQHRNNRVEALELARLSRAELAERLAGILDAPAPAMVDAVFDRSGGNPFFAEELLAAATEGMAGLPAGLREVLLLRVGDCTPPCQAVLRVAAAVGRRVEERLLAAVAPLGEAELEAGLREAVERQLLVVPPDQDVYTFRHALVQEAVYGELLPGERTRLHAALAERLGSDETGGPSSAAEVAVHWYRARHMPDALEWSARAGVDAERSYAYAEVLGHYERVLELWDRVADPEARAAMDHVEVLRRAAEAAYVTMDDRRALALVDRALRDVDPAVEPVRAALLHERRGLYLGFRQPPHARFEALSEAVRLIPTDPPSTARARLSASYAEALMLAMRYEEAEVAGQEALAMASQLGAAGEVAIALNVVGYAQATRGAFEAGIASLHEACRLAEEHGEPRTLTRAYGWLGEALMQAGRLEDSVAASLAGRAPLRRLGLEGLHHDAWLLLNAAEALFKLGRWDDADPLAAQSLAHSQGSPGPPLIVAVLEIGRGEFQAAEAHLEAAKQGFLGGDLEERRVYCELVAELRAWQGRLEEAQAAVVGGLDRLVGPGQQRCSGRLLWLGMRIEADRAEQGRARHDPRDVDDAKRAADALAARAAATTPNPLHGASRSWTSWSGIGSPLGSPPTPTRCPTTCCCWRSGHHPIPLAVHARRGVRGRPPAFRYAAGVRAVRAERGRRRA
jgi:tetratricopeptide (TPR) repeat protein